MSGADIAVQTFHVLSPVLLAAVTWVAAKLAQFINARVQNEYLRGVLVRLDDAVLSVVREVNQVTVDAIKAASVDGRLPSGACASIKAAAIASVKSHLGAKGLAELGRVLGLDDGAVDRLLNTRIEAAVHDIKAQQKKVTNGVNHTAIPGDIAPFPG